MKHSPFLVALLISACELSAQLPQRDQKYQVAVIAFWNLENLFDTLDDPYRNDDEFTPGGTNAWTAGRYREKIRRLSETISQIGAEACPDGPALLGVCEVENSRVLDDLVAAPGLKERRYRYVHVEGPDARGIDPALIYNPAYFRVTKFLSYRVQMITDSNYRTRDILVVSGLFGGEPLSILVNHWPSRRGGEAPSRPNRMEAARSARAITDSIALANPGGRILVMGDLNDDPWDESVRTGLRAAPGFARPGEPKLFNSMEALAKAGIGTLAWQDSWNLFDQILLSQEWAPGDFKSWQFLKARVFNRDFLKADYGNYKGYPFRTYSGGAYTGGYSDHFPAYITVARRHR